MKLNISAEVLSGVLIKCSENVRSDINTALPTRRFAESVLHGMQAQLCSGTDIKDLEISDFAKTIILLSGISEKRLADLITEVAVAFPVSAVLLFTADSWFTLYLEITRMLRCRHAFIALIQVLFSTSFDTLARVLEAISTERLAGKRLINAYSDDWVVVEDFYAIEVIINELIKKGIADSDPTRTNQALPALNADLKEIISKGIEDMPKTPSYGTVIYAYDVNGVAMEVTVDYSKTSGSNNERTNKFVGE